MTTSNSNIYSKLAQVQAELHVPKSSVGRFGKHRTLESILEAVKPLLQKHDLNLVISDEVVQVGDRNYVKATAYVGDGSDQLAKASAYAWEGEISRNLDASQVTGIATTYARKRALDGLLALDDTKDADSKEFGEDTGTYTVSKNNPPRTPPPVDPSDRPATGAQRAQIASYLKGMGVKDDNAKTVLTATYGVTHPMTAGEARRVIAEIEGGKKVEAS